MSLWLSSAWTDWRSWPPHRVSFPTAELLAPMDLRTTLCWNAASAHRSIASTSWRKQYAKPTSRPRSHAHSYTTWKENETKSSKMTSSSEITSPSKTRSSTSSCRSGGLKTHMVPKMNFIISGQTKFTKEEILSISRGCHRLCIFWASQLTSWKLGSKLRSFWKEPTILSISKLLLAWAARFIKI